MNKRGDLTLFPDLQSETEMVLRREDCIEGMGKLPKGSVDLVVTSPPYNLGIDYSRYDDSIHRRDYLKWCLKWAKALKRVLKKEGSFFLNVAGSPSNPLLPHLLMGQLQRVFVLQNTIHWIKSITVEVASQHPLSVGHFKPINSPRYLNDCHEYIFHLTKKGETPIDRLALGVPYQDKSNIKRWKHAAGRDLRCRGNVWFIPYKTIQNKSKERPHPATFPPDLVKNCIRLHGKGEQTVMLDPFLGIGNAGVAAKQSCVKKFFGFEIDEAYFAIAVERCEAANIS